MSKYDGMTGNERLGTAGLFDEWDDALRNQDRDRMIAILLSVDVDQAAAAQTVDVMLKNPSLYGG